MQLSRLHQSFRDAGRGIAYVARSEQNFRIQLVLSLIVIGAAFLFPLKSWEVALLVLLCLLVLMVELLNTALEHFADLVKPRLHHHVWIIKDIMAGAVLITSLGAALIGGIILFPHFLALYK